MKMLASLLLLILSSTPFITVLAAVDQRLPNEHLAYYGKDFYQKFPRLTKDDLFGILDGAHYSQDGDYDEISSVSCLTNCYEQHPLDYTQARHVIFGELHKESNGQGIFVEDVYCQKKFYFRSVDEIVRKHNSINIEHTWPQSRFSNRFSKSMQKTDMHHLFPTDSKANGVRGNHWFGEISSTENRLDLHQCETSRFGRLSRSGKEVFTPPTEHKGNVARAMFYFSTRYQMQIPPEEEKILRQWHAMDPVDTEESERHEIIANHQKVRNPFIDYPELVEEIENF